MRPLSLRQKRLLVAIWMVAFVLAAGNHYFGWGLLGEADRIAVSAMTLLAVLVFASRFGSRMMDEVQAEQDAIRREEETAERARDKSNDAAETEQLRRSIGMPPDTSVESKRGRDSGLSHDSEAP